MTDEEKKDFSASIAVDLDNWLDEVRHYPIETIEVKKIIDMLNRYAVDLNHQ
jgi:hypothetical protein